jgi:hypothetical protein
LPLLAREDALKVRVAEYRAKRCLKIYKTFFHMQQNPRLYAQFLFAEVLE